MAKSTNTIKLGKAKTPAWVAEEEATVTTVVTTPAPKGKVKAPPAEPTEKAPRQPNHNSYRWVAIDVVKSNPGKTQSELIRLMDKAKPGKDAAYWKRRITRAYKLAVKFNVALPARNLPIKAKAKDSDPGQDQDGAEIV